MLAGAFRAQAMCGPECIHATCLLNGDTLHDAHVLISILNYKHVVIFQDIQERIYGGMCPGRCRTSSRISSWPRRKLVCRGTNSTRHRNLAG